MPRKTKSRTTKRTSKIKLKSSKRLIGGLLAALFVGLIGSYLLIASRADSVPDNTVVLTDSSYSNPGQYSSYKVNPESGKINIYIKVPDQPASVPPLHFSLFLIAHLRATNFDCVSGYTCQFKTGGYTGIPSVYDYDSSINTSEINFCVPLKTTDAGRGFVIGTLNFNPGSAVHQDYSKDWRQDFYEVHAFVSGPCPNLPRDKWYTDTSVETANGATYYSGGGIKADWGERGTEGGCERNCGGDGNDGDPGDGDGNGGDGKGNDGTGEGKGAGGGGGGSGGSSADKQSSKNNTIPDSSSQGNKKQPNLIPTPFYDGKQYKPGSDSDNFVIGAVSSTGRAVVNNWPLALIVLVLASASGYVYWKKYRKQ